MFLLVITSHQQLSGDSLNCRLILGSSRLSYGPKMDTCGMMDGMTDIRGPNPWGMHNGPPHSLISWTPVGAEEKNQLRCGDSSSTISDRQQPQPAIIIPLLLLIIPLLLTILTHIISKKPQQKTSNNHQTHQESVLGPEGLKRSSFSAAIYVSQQHFPKHKFPAQHLDRARVLMVSNHSSRCHYCPQPNHYDYRLQPLS